MFEVKYYKNIVPEILLALLLIFFYAETVYPGEVMRGDSCKYNLKAIDKMQEQMLEIKALMEKVKGQVVNNEPGLAYIGIFLYFVDMPLEEIRRVYGPAVYYNRNLQIMDDYDKNILSKFISYTAKKVSKELKSFIPLANTHIKSGSVEALVPSYEKVKIILTRVALSLDKEFALKRHCYNK